VELPDIRLNKLGKIYNPKKIIHATVEFTDIVGSVREIYFLTLHLYWHLVRFRQYL
jgi:hypothetical protein